MDDFTYFAPREFDPEDKFEEVPAGNPNNLPQFSPEKLMEDAARFTAFTTRHTPPEKARKNLELAKETGLPIGLIRGRDNQEHPLPDFGKLSPRAQSAIIDSPELAVLARKNPKGFSALFDDALGELDSETARMYVEHRIYNEGYTATELNELKLLGYVQRDGKWFKRETREETSVAPAPLGAAVTTKRTVENLIPVEGTPVLPNWYQGEKGEAVNAAVQQMVNRFRETGESAPSIEEFNAGLSSRDLFKALTQDKTFLEVLYTRYGEGWLDFDDATLREVIEETGKVLNIPTEGYDISRIKPRTFEEDYTDPGQALDIYGLGKRFIDGRRGRPDAEKLVQLANGEDVTDRDLQWANEDLLRQVRDLRGATRGVRAIEGLMNAGRFMLELGASGMGGAGLRGLSLRMARYGVAKGVGKTLANMGLNALKQLGIYAPGVALDAADYAQRANYTLDDEGNPMAELTEKEAGEVAVYVVNRLVDQYIELFSEQAGVFFDKLGASKMVKSAVSKIPGKALRNGVSKFVTGHLGELASPKWRNIYKGVLSDIGLNGIWGEYGEEKVGALIRSGVSALARAFDSQLLNLTEDKMFGSLADEIETFGQVALISGTLRAPLILTAPVRAADAAMYVDNQAKWKAKFDAVEDLAKSPEATRLVYNKLVLPQTAHVDPTALRELSQSEGGEAIIEKLGITQSQLDRAELNGRMVKVSLGQAMGALDAKEHAKLIEISTPDSARSPETVEAYLEQMTDEKLQKAYEERMDYQAAYNEALSQLALLGRPDSEIRAAAKILGSTADFFGARSGMTAAEFIRKVVFKKMKEADWIEQFKKEAAAMYQVSPVWTGSAASYDKPSLHYVGTGEGQQVFGWGLYGSSSRNVAEWYANTDVRRKGAPKGNALLLDGAPFEFSKLDSPDAIYAYLEKSEEAKVEEWAMQSVADNGSVERAMRRLEDKLFDALEGDYPMDRKALAWLKANKGRVEVKKLTPHNLYKQTFWPDKQEDLLEWDEALTKAQVEKIMAQVDKDPRFEKEDYEKAKAERGHYTEVEPDKYYVWEYDEDGNKTSGHGFSRSWLEQYADPEKDWATAGDFYESMVYALGSPKAVSEFLYAAGIDGVTYVGDSSGVRNYVAFSDSDIRVDEHIMYQTAGGEVRRGVTEFDANADLSSINDTWNATITLFENADASTLIHEIEHYAVRMMECLVSSGLADERMADDLKRLKSWAKEGLTQEKYQDAISKLDSKKDRIPTFDEWLYSEAHEKIARGFEAYVREGKAPKAELLGAFSVMRRLLTQVYRSAKLLNVDLTDDVREIFDEMLATEGTIAANSDLAEVIRSIDPGLLGLTKAEVGDYQKLLEKANDQAWQELHAEKLRQLKVLRSLWAKDAKALMAEERVYAAWNDIRKTGGIDFASLVELVGVEAANVLKLKGLTSKSGRAVNTENGVSYPDAKPGTHPAEFAARHGYDSIDEMASELIDAASPKEFIDSYVKDAVGRFNQEFQFSDAAASVEAVSEALDKLSADLEKVSGRENFWVRRAELRRKAEETIAEKPVSKIVKDNDLVKECKRHSGRIVEAITKQDYLTAAEEVSSLRGKLEELRYKARAEKVIRKLQDRFRKTLALKRGRMDGDYQDAIIDLAIRLGLSKREAPKHTVASVIEAYNEAHPDQQFDAPAIALEGAAKFSNLKYKDAEAIYNLVEFLYYEGRDLVSDARQERVEHRENTIKEAVDFMASGKKDRAPDTTTKILTSLSSVGSKLRNILGFAARWDENSVFFREILDPVKLAESQATTLLNHPKQSVLKALKSLYASGRKWDFSGIQGIRFPSFLTRTNNRYTKWDAPMVIMACLNMGNARNRQALLKGFGWQESDLQQIAAVLSKSDWSAIQQIWDAINEPSITSRLQTVFRNIYHYDLPMEPASEFDVVTSNGEVVTVPGGYFPLNYSGHLNPETRELTSLSKEQALPEYRRAGFTYARHDNIGDPVDLSNTDLILTHLYDVTHYVTHVEAVRQIMPVVRDIRFKTEFIAKEGKPRYDALIKLLDHVADPSAAFKGQVSEWERWARSVKSSLALWGSLKTVVKQGASALIGVDELDKGRYLENVFHVAASPRETRAFISELSGFMADRTSSRDLDLLLQNDGAFRKGFGHLMAKLRAGGFALEGLADFYVAAPAWLTVYDTALDKGKSKAQAIAEADDFVARTQGGTRPMDASPIQLNPAGRLITMFFTAASAGATSTTRAFGKMYYERKLNPAAIFLTVLSPIVASSIVDWAMSGDDDDDDFWSGFTKAAVRNSVSGHLVADTVMQALTSAGRGDLLKVPALEGLNRVYSGTVDALKAASNSDWQRVLYRVAEVAGTLNQTPVLTAYDRLVKMAEDWNDGDLDADLREEFGHIKDKNK